MKKNKRQVNELNTKFCLVCHKPMLSKGNLCVSCKRKMNKLRDKGLKITNQTHLIYMKEHLGVDDIFKYLEDNPNICESLRSGDKKERREPIKKIKQELRSSEYKECKYNKERIVPLYINELFEKNQTMELLYLNDSRTNPTIYCKCKKCGEDLQFTYNDFRKSKAHNCLGIKSSGEIIVEEYLKSQKIKYLCQGDTFRCVNPNTNHLLPYDFEIPDKKILIEVQGEQHLRFIERFHITLENFEYQKWKDRYKKEYAINNGYLFIEIFYDDIKTNKYIEIINTALKKENDYE